MLANLAAMPVVSVLVMPAGLLGIAAIPFGFDGVFWRLMDVGIEWMIVVTQWVAALPGAIGRMAAFGTGPLLLTTAGIVVLGLLRTPLRWAGGAMIVLATVWAVAPPQPDILVAGDGHHVGVRGEDGRLHVMSASKDAFLLREWLAADADARTAADASLSTGVSCDEAGCVVKGAGGTYVALALKPEALADDCARAAIIVTSYPPPVDCAAFTLDRDTLQRTGTVALRRQSGTASGYAMTATHPRGVYRPWSPAMAESMKSSTSSARTAVTKPRALRPVDATPAQNDMQAEE